MHRLLVGPTAMTSETVTFSEAQWHQLRDVLRLRAGDRLRVFDGVEPLDLIVELTERHAARVVDRCAQAPEPRHQLVAYPALLQRSKFESVLQKLTELGVAAITPVLTERGLVREPPDDARVQRWQAILREATEQCGRGVVPTLQPALEFEGALRQALSGSRVVVAFERERHQSLRAALADAPYAVSMFVGPEGGLTEDEAVRARARGARLVTLGPRILRTETASPVLAALVLYELGDLSSWEPHHEPG
jgi:16S rRNA (uracil1498-N3)-methyltransferase